MWGVAWSRVFETSYVRAHRTDEKQQPNFRTAINLDVRKILHGRPRMLTSDLLFAVANLFVLMITLAVSVMCVKNVTKMTSMLLMLVVLGAFIPASQALTCYHCLYCADPYEPSSSSRTCQGEVCAKVEYEGEGRFKIHLLCGPPP